LGRVKAVLFDLDGVLVDAADWHYEAFNRALGRFGYTITRPEHLQTYDGLPTRNKLEILSRDKGLPPALHATIHQLKQEFTRDQIIASCRPVPEKRLLLRRLKEEGRRLGVCSNAIRESVHLMLGQSGLMEYLDCVLSQEEVELPKPAPDIYREAMTRLQSPPGETVIVEDGRHGVESGRRAGGHVLQVETWSEVDYGFVRRFIDEVERAPVNP